MAPEDSERQIKTLLSRIDLLESEVFSLRGLVDALSSGMADTGRETRSSITAVSQPPQVGGYPIYVENNPNEATPYSVVTFRRVYCIGDGLTMTLTDPGNFVSDTGDLWTAQFGFSPAPTGHKLYLWISVDLITRPLSGVWSRGVALPEGDKDTEIMGILELDSNRVKSGAGDDDNVSCATLINTLRLPSNA